MKKHLIMLLFVFALAFPFAQKTNAANNLQQLIDDTPNDGVLQLEATTYTGPATVTKPITIIGQDGTVIISDKIGLSILNTVNVTLQQLKFETTLQPIQANNVTNLTVERMAFNLLEEGIELKNIDQLILHSNRVIGLKEAHFSRKPNGYEIYESSNITVDDVTVENVQDGMYFERSKEIAVTNTHAENGRYGLHFMYGDNITLQHNTVINNVTGLMLMIINNLEVTNNEIVRQLALNSNGMYIYDVANGRIQHNVFRENTVATVWNRVTDTLFENNEFQSNGTVIESERSPEVKMTDNVFQGNILVARSDKQGFVLQSNTYDDYDGYDFNKDGIGDTPHQTYTSFGQWMVRKPVYQYFIESPSVVLLNKMDNETETTDDILLVDPLPQIAVPNSMPQLQIAWWQLFIGLAGVSMITFGWRKLR